MKKTDNIKSEETGFKIDVKELLFSCLGKWYWFVISISLAVGIAYFKVLRTVPVYSRSAQILLKPDENRSSGRDLESVLNSGIMSNSNYGNVNEMSVMSSLTIVRDVVQRLQLNVEYTYKGRFHKEYLYESALPFTVDFIDLSDNEQASFVVTKTSDDKITLNDIRFRGTIYKGMSIDGALDDTIKMPFGRIIIKNNEYHIGISQNDIRVTHYPLVQTTRAFKGKLKIVKGGGDKRSESDVISIIVNDNIPQRASDFISMLINVYSENWMRDRNQKVRNTAVFINKRLDILENDLDTVDTKIATFKSDLRMPSIEAMAAISVEKNNDLKNKMLSLEDTKHMLLFVKNDIINITGKDKLLPHTSSEVTDKLIAEYNALIMKRNDAVFYGGDNDPRLGSIDAKLDYYATTILASIERETKSIDEMIAIYKLQENVTDNKVAQSPMQTKELSTMGRQQKVKEALYIYLLQKREENELSQAFTAYNIRIIENPWGSSAPILPVSKRTILIGLVIGFVIPIGILYIQQISVTTIRGRKDIENVVTIPVIGEVPQKPEVNKKSVLDFLKKDKKSKKSDHLGIIVKEGSRDMMNEAFRVMRTNIEFMSNKNDGAAVIVVTSFNPGSGKTFISLNVAMSLAIKGEKTLLIDGDLRHASASKYFKSNKKGFSNYLNGQINDLSEVIIQSPQNANLWMLPVGVIPPNPTELLLSDKMNEMMEKIRNEYSFIIFDCPPIDIVADTQIIEKHAERTFFVVRAGLMERSLIPDLQKIYDDNKFKNMSLIINGTVVMSGYGYHYGYRYGYHNNYYGNGYYGNYYTKEDEAASEEKNTEAAS